MGRHMGRQGHGRAHGSRRDKVEHAWRAEARRAGNVARFQRPRRRNGISGPALVYCLCLGLLLGWYGPGWMARIGLPRIDTPMQSVPADHRPVDQLSADFGYCHDGGGANCVVDGDTFRFRGETYRIADIDTPETHGPRCAAEGALGAQATQRLQTLMNDGPFSLESGDRDTDRYGRTLRIVTREGQSIGDRLVAEGLARHWDGSRHPWC
ncbi:thermonuclease family protein [Sphingobium sp. HBC34]|uniref:Thermonuclease family protein n=1 Tax=Sphingobium cyanobacteriorum TaxID=3063954 RepID=A0ABT8ZPX1_9SPHN|nr:thermonuclease family protein [Sphingobium sp. HBC34]MDO7836592.1 thermonuclease family protein [Sphingobium sp. HBC34]